MNIEIHGDPPKKAGLGASASLSTALIAGILRMENKPININQIAENTYNVEQNILLNTGGRQDQYAAVYGGFNLMEFHGGSDVRINKLKISKSFRREIESNLILFYTGEPHVSGNMVQKQVDSYLKNRKKAKKSLDKLKEIAFSMKDSLLSENFEEFGKLLTEDWIVKTEFNPYITTNYMRELNKLVIKNGGIGGRVCGAGGGGCIFWLVNPDSKKHIASILNNKPGKIIDFKFVDNGLNLSHIDIPVNSSS
ncbi:MAG: GHMP family kinase ATP-binding protein [Promethearchaeota archaeon]